jgi:hypothetical protein
MNFLINKICEIVYDNVISYIYTPKITTVSGSPNSSFIIVTPDDKTNKSVMPLKTIEHLNEIKNFEFKKNLHYYINVSNIKWNEGSSKTAWFKS